MADTGESVVEAVAATKANDETKAGAAEKEDHDMGELVDAEEYLERNASSLMEYEKQMFLDTLHADGLVVCAK
jgi:DNA excision repair protein ERCC-4